MSIALYKKISQSSQRKLSIQVSTYSRERERERECLLIKALVYNVKKELISHVLMP